MPATRIAELEEALRDATAAATACKAFVDEQANRYFDGKRPNWKKAAIACFDELDGRADEWAAILATPSEDHPHV